MWCVRKENKSSSYGNKNNDLWFGKINLRQYQSDVYRLRNDVVHLQKNINVNQTQASLELMFSESNKYFFW